MEYRVAVFGVARASDLGQLLDDVIPFPLKKLGKDFVVQSQEKFRVPGHVAAVEKRNRKLNILRVKSLAFGKSTGGWTELEPQIPKLLAKGANRVPQIAFRIAIGV